MNMLSTAPLKGSLDFESFSGKFFNKIRPFIESKATAILLLDMPSGSGQTSSLNFINYRLSVGDDGSVENDEFREVVSLICLVSNTVNMMIGGTSFVIRCTSICCHII